jgi:hypothetical protein
VGESARQGETLLDAGWVRVQNVPPLYLDFRRRLTAAQAVAVRKLFETRFEQVVIEFGGDVHTFTDGETALSYVVGDGPRK